MMVDGYLVISQARMTSTRLPGKVLKSVDGKTLLEMQIERVRRAKQIANLLVATTVNQQDDVIMDLCGELACPVFRGSEHDVLSRYWGALKLMPHRYCIRITSDCPLIDPQVIDECIGQYKTLGCDYLTSSPSYPNGMNVEIFRFDMLEEAAEKAKPAYEREHVTPYFYTRPERFKIAQATAPRVFPPYRLTVDTPEDLRLIEALVARLNPTKPQFTLDEICEEMAKDPALSEINSSIKQKLFYE